MCGSGSRCGVRCVPSLGVGLCVWIRSRCGVRCVDLGVAVNLGVSRVWLRVWG